MSPSVWWSLLGVAFVVGVLLQIYLLAAFAAMLAVVSALAAWWQRRALDGVIYRRRLHYRRGFPGEKIQLRIEAENRKLLPISWLRALDDWPHLVGPEDESVLALTHNPDLGVLVNLFSLRWFERARRTYELLLRKRGVYPLGPARLETGDLFGLFEQSRSDETLDFVTVFPTPAPFDSLQLPSEDPFGDRKARRRLYEDPSQPVGIRDYHPEDDFRRVHWPATAHTGDLQVKVYQPASAQVLVICLNVTTMPFYWQGTYPELLEHLVGVAAALVERGLHDGYRVGLISNGSMAHSDQPFRIQPGRSKDQLAHLLGSLAAVTPFVSMPFEAFLSKEAHHLPYGATLLVVTGLMSQELAETLVRLKGHGRRITLLSFAAKPPPFIPGVHTVHRPFTG